MAERFDITLGGQGYMVAPGSYRRQQAGGAAVAAGLSQAESWGSRRVVQRAWRGGLQSQQEEPDRFWASVGLRPLAREQAVGPGPRERAPLTVAGLDTTAPRHAVLVNGRPYFAAGQALWRVERAGGLDPDNLGGCTQLGGALGVPATGLAVSDDSTLFVARGGSDLWSWPIAGAAFTTYPLKFNGVAVYAGGVWGLGSLDEPRRLLRVTDLATAAVDPAGWLLDGTIRGGVLARDALYVATAGALWKVKGMVDPAGVFQGEIAPLVVAGGAGYGDSFAYLADFGGDLYTWYAGQVMRYRATVAGAATLEPTGLVAGGCRGLAVAGEVLVAAVQDTPQYPGGQLWAFDGRGWWCIARNTGGASPDYWAPLPTANYTLDADLLAFDFGQDTLHGFQLRSYPTQPGLATAGELVTSLWHGGEPDADKVWLRVGAEFVTPGAAAAPGLPSFAACTIELAYTLDGTNFTTAGSTTLDTPAARTVAFDLPAATIGKLLALAYRLSGVDEGAPSLAALWAEYRVLEPPARRRAWTFDILAADETVARDGAPDTRTGRQIAADLWATWQGGAALAFRDIDYDLDPTARTVRLAALDEQVKTPADAGRWGEARVRVQLIEE